MSAQIRSAYDATVGRSTPCRRAAVSGASGSSSVVHSTDSTPVSRATSRASESPSRAPVCTGFTTTTEPVAVAASAAVATVLPTPVEVPVTTVITDACSLTTATRTSTARAQSASGIPALTVIRSREIPSGTDGGRKQPDRHALRQRRGLGRDGRPAGAASAPTAPRRRRRHAERSGEVGHPAARPCG